MENHGDVNAATAESFGPQAKMLMVLGAHMPKLTKL
jgi:hypothetical protein